MFQFPDFVFVVVVEEVEATSGVAEVRAVPYGLGVEDSGFVGWADADLDELVAFGAVRIVSLVELFLVWRIGKDES